MLQAKQAIFVFRLLTCSIVAEPENVGVVDENNDSKNTANKSREIIACGF